ncbi:MaoC/PaaZ C-terminal domain-containing protein [Rhodococcus sp. T2V]|uniref:MaoC/PaaZ C-terminal domain-containing protein n=1 Tax=Rhodococcus sp. T2V TaxID=3034164 RepID=UPI0023E321D6|nr:MaoC/PaaZ C-terminal domain-containing protein [Rhodococcus sp. T2V]MDF3309544.1 MaoC/PaaZ C-terminal domain-containing protein [Rhodococcus sp. T2V]
MPIDVAAARGAELPERRFRWDESDVILYHLGVGAGALDEGGGAALRYLYENAGFQVLPSFAIVAPTFHEAAVPSLEIPGCDIDLGSVLHYDQQVEVEGPISRSGEAVLRSRVCDVFDARDASLIVREGQAFADDGRLLWTVRDTIYVRGEDAAAGQSRPRLGGAIPDRPADVTRSFRVLPQQAMLYRLCGDRNPLHVDPAFAAKAGFDKPILHGLCTYGIVLREAVDALFGGDTEVVRSFYARFAGVVLPTETLVVEMWEEGRCAVVQAGIIDAAGGPTRPALANGLIETSGSGR